MKKFYLIALAAALCGGMAAAQPRSASAPQKLISAASGLMAPVWSPNGDKIAVTSDNYTGIYVANADGSNLEMLTSEAGAGYKMVWTADGTEIVGRTNIVEDARVLHELKAWNVNSGKATLIAEKSRTAAAPTLKAAGKAARKANVYDIMTADATRAAAQIDALNAFAGKTIINPALSPDASMVAFQIVGKGMWVINADGTNLRSLGAGSHPAWMPDSKSIVYTVVADNGSQFTSSTLYSMDIATGTSYVLTRQDGIIPMTPSVSPDGKKVVFENAADAAIYIINLKF